MNILFLTLLDFKSLQDHNIYADLMREFVRHGHKVFIVSPIERRQQQATRLIKEENAQILKLEIGNTQKTNIIEKGLSTLTIEPLFVKGIKKHFADVKFDLVIYSTPPITFCNAIKYVVKCDGAKTYLLLKDIFPQNAVDIGMMTKEGVRGLIYRFFRNKEKKLYAMSDRIGCMSQANADYVIKHNPEVDCDKVGVCPNCIEPQMKKLMHQEKLQMRDRYGLPRDKRIYVYGGNLGRPQDVPFIVSCLKSCMNKEQSFFLVTGSGTDRHYLETFTTAEHPQNVRLLDAIPKDEYDGMIACCDVGLIFLDHRFTIPNYPSRLLVYMQAALPVLCCTDECTDIGNTVQSGQFGWRCSSCCVSEFSERVEKINQELPHTLEIMGDCAYEYLVKHYSTQQVYQDMIHSFQANFEM